MTPGAKFQRDAHMHWIILMTIIRQMVYESGQVVWPWLCDPKIFIFYFKDYYLRNKIM